jgi:hypothetical protein
MAFRNFEFSLLSSYSLWKFNLIYLIFRRSFHEDETLLKYIVPKSDQFVVSYEMSRNM